MALTDNDLHCYASRNANSRHEIFFTYVHMLKTKLIPRENSNPLTDYLDRTDDAIEKLRSKLPDGRFIREVRTSIEHIISEKDMPKNTRSDSLEVKTTVTVTDEEGRKPYTHSSKAFLYSKMTSPKR